MEQARRDRSFAARPASIPEARRFVAQWLREGDLTQFGDRVKLSVSELATNAVLHTARPFTVSLRHIDARVRVEVVDSAPELVPVRVPTIGSAVDLTSHSQTGRGLQIVSALANRWGMTLDPNVKAVWCEFDGVELPDRPSDPRIDDNRVESPRPSNVHRLVFIGLPVRAAIASAIDVEDAIRDVQLQDPARRNAATEALLSLVERTASLRLARRHAAMQAAGENRLRFDLEVDASDDALAVTEELNRALADRPRPPRGAPGPSPEVLALRAWLRDEAWRQRQGQPPTPFPSDATIDPATWLWDQAPCGYATLTPEGCIGHANTTLLGWLGREADEIVGRFVTELLDAESRPAFTDKVLPTLRSAGHIQDVELILTRADGSPLDTQMSAVLERDGTGTPLAIRAVLDAAERRNADGRGGERAQALVRALQQTLIPPAPPAVPGLDVATAYHPGQGEVGGDFYDVFEVADGDWCVVLGDVSGKGVEAAILTSTARHAVRSAALREPAPSGLMRVLNDALLAKASSRFCTVALLRLQLTHGSWVATLTSGGHPFPLLVRHGAVTKMGRPGSLLGVFKDVAFHDVSIKLAAGDALVLYTDGITEARNEAGEFFGDQPMVDAIVGAAHSAQAMVDAVVSRVLDFQAGPSDDIALVVVRRPSL